LQAVLCPKRFEKSFYTEAQVKRLCKSFYAETI